MLSTSNLKKPQFQNVASNSSMQLSKCLRTLIILSLAVGLTFYYINKPITGSQSYTKDIPFRNYCTDIPAISAEEFRTRQDSLAKELHALNASAYIAEPGADAHYFGNISQTSWHLSERPLLLIISPTVFNLAVEAKVTILTPKFEASRARLLSIPGEDIAFIEWAEDEDPYIKALSSISGGLKAGSSILLSEATRLFIRDGLQSAAPAMNVLTAPYSIHVLRERKSPAEIALLRCVNEATLLAIRYVREELHFGIRQSEAYARVSQVLITAGLLNPSGLVLFGENAARPHGGPIDKSLNKDDLILFDIGATLHGYTSDVTRTFALETSEIPPRYLALWQVVKIAQEFALSAATVGTMGQDVDKTARDIITRAGFGRYFTHRLGHGIGLEGHESPYLRGGSMDVLLPGHTFSNEPGIYIEGEVGVRLEDCFVIQDNGSAVYLTEGVGGAAKDPWHI